MRVLVTGISGHVGGAVAKQLLEAGHEVHGVSRTLPVGPLATACTCHAMGIAAPDFVEALSPMLGPCDAVVHAAACQDMRLDATKISRINAFGTHQVLALALRLGARQCVYLSSLSLLGLPQTHPVTEAHPVAPSDAYALSKYYGEQLCHLAEAEGLPCAALRISSPIGPGLRYRRIFRLFVEKALRHEPITLHGQGARRQDYVDVRDIARAVLLTLEKAGGCSGVYQIGSGQPVSNRELAESCIRTLDSRSEIGFSGQPDPHDAVCWDLSLEKAAKELGFAPRHGLEDSIRNLAAELD